MRNLKRALSLTLASVMLLGMMVIGTSAAPYADQDQISNVTAATVLKELNVMVGDGTTFGANTTVTRGQMAIIICKILYGDKLNVKQFADANTFTDVPANSYFAGYVNLANELGIISGYGNGQFGPGDPVSTAVADDPIAYYTASTKTDSIQRDLRTYKITTSAATITGANLYVDGVKAAAFPNWTDWANGSDDEFEILNKLTGNGTEVYIYADTAGNVNKVIVNHNYLAEVTKVKTDSDGRYVTLDVFEKSGLDKKTFYTENFAEGDYVQVTVAKGSDGKTYVASAKAVESSEGNVTAIHTTDSYLRLDGTQIKYAADMTAALDDDKPLAITEYKLYLDEFGYVLFEEFKKDGTTYWKGTEIYVDGVKDNDFVVDGTIKSQISSAGAYIVKSVNADGYVTALDTFKINAAGTTAASYLKSAMTTGAVSKASGTLKLTDGTIVTYDDSTTVFIYVDKDDNVSRGSSRDIELYTDDDATTVQVIKTKDDKWVAATCVIVLENAPTGAVKNVANTTAGTANVLAVTTPIAALTNETGESAVAVKGTVKADATTNHSGVFDVAPAASKWAVIEIALPDGTYGLRATNPAWHGKTSEGYDANDQKTIAVTSASSETLKILVGEGTTVTLEIDWGWTSGAFAADYTLTLDCSGLVCG